jgi:hypothetical protein
MPLVTPSWFKGRQGKAEPAGPDTYHLTGPNLREAYLSIRKAENGCWSAALRFTADGPDEVVTEPEFTTEYDAWEAAFELFRTRVVT